MNKFFHIMSLGLLQVLTLVSCSEDKIINVGGSENNESKPVLTDVTVTASIKTSDLISSRANWTGDSFAWNENDHFSLWNRNLGLNHKFSIVPEGNMKSSADFTGKTTVVNGHRFIAVYPYQDTVVFNKIGHFVLDDTIRQASDKPELADKTFMIATGIVADNRMPELSFKPITSLLNFKLKNTCGHDIAMKYLTVKCDDRVFPLELAVDDNGEITDLMNACAHRTVDLESQTVADGAEINVGLNVLPTVYGDKLLMKKNSRISVITTIFTGQENKDIVLMDKIPADKIVEETGIDLSNTAYQFMPGSCYNFNYDVDYHFKVPKEGYLIDEAGQIHIYNMDGLKAWKDELVNASPKAHVILEKEYMGSEVDMSGYEWLPVEMFSGDFNANGVTLKNLTIAHSGMFVKNIGTIRHLTIDSPKFKSDVTKQAGIISSTNNGVIDHCTIKNMEANVVKPVKFGGITGENVQPGKVSACEVTEGMISLKLNDADKGNASLGGLVGENYGGTGIILASHATGLTIDHPSNSYGASNVGGLVGYNNVGKVEACYVLANLKINCSAQTGGLAGVNANGTVLASYSAVSIEGGGTNNTGGLIGYNNGGTTVVTSSYSITNSTMNHANFGLLIGNNAGNVDYSYTVSDTDKMAIKKGKTAIGYEPKVKDNQELVSHLTEMNLAIEQFIPELKWNFKQNEDLQTVNDQPLVLQYGVAVPGHKADNFENGGNI